MIKDQLVIIYWITFFAFIFLMFQRFYIHLNEISSIQLIFVKEFFNEKIFFHYFLFYFQSLFSILLAIPILIANSFVSPPARYPDLWPVLISAYSCVYFLITLIQFHIYQWKETNSMISKKKLR